ncbi:MAG TPA: RNA pseudouridine synthase [Burkholderiaceae bacterium]|nr:RNA pseudouridine synthase [Burkholderiaceae bacterium]
MTEPVRLAKRLAELLSCSRRDAEQYIEGGWVLVDGEVVEEPQHRVLEHKVELLPGAELGDLPPVTLLLHKPAGVLAHEDSAPLVPLLGRASHAADDRSGVRPLKKHFSRLTLCAPLETAASGLVVLSQDWRVVRKLREDAALMEQELVVEVSGSLDPDGLERLGRSMPSLKVSWQSETRLRFAVKGPQPGQVAWLCEQAGLQVLAVKRIRIGRVPMAGLVPGQWRYLPAHAKF